MQRRGREEELVNFILRASLHEVLHVEHPAIEMPSGDHHPVPQLIGFVSYNGGAWPCKIK
jgi:hypothetical protein